MVTVYAANRCGRFMPAHVIDLVLREAICLKIRQTPVGVPEAWPDSRCRLVRFNRVFLKSDTLKGMTERDVQLERIRRAGEDLAIYSNCLCVASETDTRRGVE